MGWGPNSTLQTVWQADLLSTLQDTAYLEQAGLVATAQCRLPQPAADQFAVVKADKAVHGAHMLLPSVHFLSRLQIDKQPGVQHRVRSCRLN